MDTNIQAALVGLVGGLIAVSIGAVASSFTTIWVNRKQLSIGYDKLKLEVLHKKIERLEALLTDLSDVKVELRKDRMEQGEMIAQGIMAFGKKIANAKQCYHYLPDDLVSELGEIERLIGEIAVAAKTGKSTGAEKINKSYARVREADKKLQYEVTNKLRVWNSEMEHLTKAGKN